MARKTENTKGTGPDQERARNGGPEQQRRAAPIDPVAPTEAAAPTEPTPPRSFPIVGIGASAGGLEALEALFGSVPADPQMAFVVVTHQHPGHDSMLVDLLGRCTSLPVLAISDGIKIRPNQVYICPPGGQLDILNGTLHRMDAENPVSPRQPIDHFFRSLALDQRENAICIVLSGAGSDGTNGLMAIKGESGMAMVQVVATAKFAGMPSSAIATGLVDYVLPPEQMPAQLLAYVAGPYLAVDRKRDTSDLPGESLQKIFVLLRSRTGHDFSSYKSSTIRRRIERRMNVHQITRPTDYLRYLQENPHEIDTLFRELLISVTGFFRDREAFDVLAASALPDLMTSRPENYTLRIWVPGCASGEEVYSLAILMREAMEATKRPFEVVIFGTDLDSQAIETARAGLYPETLAADVQPQRLERFFLHEESGYRVRKDIREMAIFSVQNVVKDPPFIKLDMISCRNLLIYLEADMQAKLMALFHYALKPGGLLMLGPSETAGPASALFDPLDKKWKLFRRKDSPLGEHPVMATATPTAGIAPPHDTGIPNPAKQSTTIGALVDRLLLARFAPACVVVNDRGDVVFIHGRTGDYLELSAGHPRLNVVEMAREGLQLDLRSALRHAAAHNAEVLREAVRVRTNGKHAHIDLCVTRIAEPEPLRGLFLVSFRPRPAPISTARRRHREGRADESGRVEQLERELQYVNESLQTTIEELEASNEELKSANEELQSTNEEFQSTNEELETSKEEMQSLNEELTTVNAELHAKVEQLSRANDDMQNLLNSTEIATLFLDSRLNISRYTDQARRLISLIPSDVGRPLADLFADLRYDHLVADCREVLRTLVFVEAEVQTGSGDWYLMRIRPYRTAENMIDGLVLTFVDINAVKHVEQELAASKERLQEDLLAMTKLQEIGALFAQEADPQSIMEEVLEAALSIARAERCMVSLLDAESGQVAMIAQQGFNKTLLEFWSVFRGHEIPCAAGAVEGAWMLVEDIDRGPPFADPTIMELHRKAGVRALRCIPMSDRSQRVVGMISIHYRAPCKPDARVDAQLGILANQAGAILGRCKISRQ